MKVLIIGACGYVGSMLYDDLVNLYDVTCVDVADPIAYPPHIQSKGGDVDISGYDIILYFSAGLCRKSDCEIENRDRLYESNVVDLVSLVKKMNDDQVCIYATTGSLYYNQQFEKESDPINTTSFPNYEWSMWRREEETKVLGKKTIGLRLGSVMGVSKNMRPELIYNGMYYSAFSYGYVQANNLNSRRSILWYPDLLGVITEIIKDKSVTSDIFNVGSFNSTIGDIATMISDKTNTNLITSASSTDKGFHMDCSKTSKRFGYTFKGNHDSMHEYYCLNKTTLLNHVNSPNGLHMKCLICRNAKIERVLDLGTQPLANNFVNTSENVPSYPLEVYRCMHCTHTQLNYIVNRESLFRNYIYESGTSQTLRDDFKRIAETYTRRISKINPTVLELACNDGYQLDEFKALGWKTYGIDPAKNQVEKAIAKGHSIDCKFWGTEPSTLVDGIELDLILAENVVAHVTNPVGFIRTCANVMTDATLLVVQTSQANMYANNEFDTIYHEHISFFTVRSMMQAAKNAGCTVVHVYKTPIHGISYVFEIRKGVFPVSDSLVLQDEIKLGLYTDDFYTKYTASIHGLKSKCLNVLKTYSESGYHILGFGAAAKGNVFLNYIFDSSPNPLAPEFIMDDSTLKQGKFTPGTQIEVVGHSKIEEYTGKKVVIVILAWNFATEIIQRISKRFPKDSEYECVQFFPSFKVTKANECALDTIQPYQI
jgi:nucleoside-diphosphate-sugar epimerase/2-polyprenyl-3-methyl-5-hydroxy-6-metoxy-1,4-benzoquinol methylase